MPRFKAPANTVSQFYSSTFYRPGQPYYEYKLWKFQNFSDTLATQILRGINAGHFKAVKTALLTILVRAALNFECLENLDIFRCEIFPNQNSKHPKWLKWQS